MCSENSIQRRIIMPKGKKKGFMVKGVSEHKEKRAKRRSKKGGKKRHK